MISSSSLYTDPSCYGGTSGKIICMLWVQEGHEIPAEIRIYNQQEKVFRIMKNNLLNHIYSYRSQAKRVVDPIVTVNAPNEIWEMDIKYIYSQGENRTTYFFAMIDCFTREVMGKCLRYHCTSVVVRKTMVLAFLDIGIEMISRVRIRSDNGTHFVSRTVELFLSSSNIHHERICPATLKKDAQIESLNSILENEVIRRFEFPSLENAGNIISMFIEFYNNERLHTAIGYITSREMKKCGKDSENLKSYTTILFPIRRPNYVSKK